MKRLRLSLAILLGLFFCSNSTIRNAEAQSVELMVLTAAELECHTLRYVLTKHCGLHARNYEELELCAEMQRAFSLLCDFLDTDLPPKEKFE